MKMVEDFVAATIEQPPTGSSSSLGGEGNHHTDYTGTNGDFKGGEIIDIQVKSINQYDINEEAGVDKILEGNRRDMEDQGQRPGNNILEDDNNGILEKNGSKKHTHKEERQLVGCLSCFGIFMPQGHHGEDQLKENGNLPGDSNTSQSKPMRKENASALPRENGNIDRFSPLNAEKAVQEPLPNGTDDHLIELSETLRTVANTLRRVSEGNASALEEAAEWKRKYELERARNLHLEQKGLLVPTVSSEGHHGEDQIKENGNLPDEHVRVDEICSHEVLHSGPSDPDSNILQRKLMRKASIKLSWSFNGDKSDQHKRDIVSFEMGNITTAGRSSKQISLKWETPPQTVLILIKPDSTSVQVLCSELVRWFKEEKGINIFVEPRVRGELLSESSYYSFVQTWQEEKEIMGLHKKVDFVVTLGGDGTVLWAASLFKGAVPPIVPFSLGSLGFMTTLGSKHYREYLSTVLHGPISITLRHRLQCYVVRHSARSEINEHDGPILVLNEVTIDRGISSFLANLECFCDDIFVTRVQGDGLILSTTSGSTAYSLAAGGSMVHPQVPGILFTPICPHSLSFRPLILPEHVTVKVLVPLNSRGHAWASFDGKNRKQLGPGDALVCSMAPWPVPTACQSDSTSDFLNSIHDGLHWNLRKTQSSDGPRET